MCKFQKSKQINDIDKRPFLIKEILHSYMLITQAVKILLHSEKSFIKGPCEEGIQQVLVNECKTKNPTTEPEPVKEKHKTA